MTDTRGVHHRNNCDRRAEKGVLASGRASHCKWQSEKLGGLGNWIRKARGEIRYKDIEREKCLVGSICWMESNDWRLKTLRKFRGEFGSANAGWKKTRKKKQPERGY